LRRRRGDRSSLPLSPELAVPGYAGHSLRAVSFYLQDAPTAVSFSFCTRISVLVAATAGLPGRPWGVRHCSRAQLWVRRPRSSAGALSSRSWLSWRWCVCPSVVGRLYPAFSRCDCIRADGVFLLDRVAVVTSFTRVRRKLQGEPLVIRPARRLSRWGRTELADWGSFFINQTKQWMAFRHSMPENRVEALRLSSEAAEFSRS
jgi:hypothetical protein